MSCMLCASRNEAEFATEMNIHFPGLQNLDKPDVLVFPKVLVCLDCGFSQFATPETEVAPLATGTAACETATRSRESRGCRTLQAGAISQS